MWLLVGGTGAYSIYIPLELTLRDLKNMDQQK